MKLLIIIAITTILLSSCVTTNIKDLTQDQLFKKSDTIREGLHKRGFEDVYLHFKHDSFELEDNQWGQIEEVANAVSSLITDNVNVILLLGHTDSSGDEEYNYTLSHNRAQTVKRVLVDDFGIEASKIFIGGKGESELLRNPENNENDMQLNRRVQVSITTKSQAQGIIAQITKEKELFKRKKVEMARKIGDKVSFAKRINVKSDDCIWLPFVGKVCHEAGFKYRFYGKVTGVADHKSLTVTITGAELVAMPAISLVGDYKYQAESIARSWVGKNIKVDTGDIY